MPSLGVPEIVIGVLLFAGLAGAVYSRLRPEANTRKYDFETW
jgi:hypothetical protein